MRPAPGEQIQLSVEKSCGNMRKRNDENATENIRSRRNCGDIESSESFAYAIKATKEFNDLIQAKRIIERNTLIKKRSNQL